MSRKTVEFKMPPPAAEATARVVPLADRKKKTTIDHWVSAPQHPTESALVDLDGRDARKKDPSISVSFSDHPDWMQAAKMMLLPQTMFWLWSIRATERAMRAFMDFPPKI